MFLAFFLWLCSFFLGLFIEIKISSIDDYHWALKYKPNYYTFKSIFLNNLKVIVTNAIGFLTLGLLTIFNTAINGFILGNEIRVSLKSIPIKWILLGFLPHSFEIIGIIFSAAIGLQLTFLLFKSKNGDTLFIWEYCKNALFLLFISLLIILAAALVETFVTLNIVS